MNSQLDIYLQNIEIAYKKLYSMGLEAKQNNIVLSIQKINKQNSKNGITLAMKETPEQQKVHAIVDEIDTHINSLLAAMNGMSIIDRDRYIGQRHERLTKIRSFLAGNMAIFFKNTFDQILKSELKRLYDVMNGRLEISTYLTRLGQFTGVVFTEFAKGVSYFRSEYDPDDPTHAPISGLVYHRDASCGSNKQQATTKFGHIKPNMDAKKIVYRCYLERLLYDRLFKHYGTEQDPDHKNELAVMKRYHDELFPMYDLNIDLNFDTVTQYPIKLFIEVADATTKATIFTESYSRTLKQNSTGMPVYEDLVECEKRDLANNKEYVKIQTFDKEEDWVEKTI